MSLLRLTVCFMLSSLLASGAYAYQNRTAFESEHFALYEVILDDHEVPDAEFWYTLCKDFTAQNDTEKRYQSTVAVFPKDSQGLKGKINEKMLGTVTVASYGEGTGKAVFNDKENFATYAGLNLTFDILTNWVDQKALNSLLSELPRLPIILKNVPVTLRGTDYQRAFYITAANKAVLLDFKAIDSVFYKASDIRAINNKCTVDLMMIIDRMLPGIPLFISAHGAVNRINCPQGATSAAPQAPAQEAATAPSQN